MNIPEQILKDMIYYNDVFDGFRVYKCVNPGEKDIFRVYPPKGVSPNNDKLLENKYLFELIMKK